MLHTFRNEELRDIILGKTTFKKCLSCDNNGQEWWDGDTGLGVGSVPPTGIPHENISHVDCDNCNGLGYIQNSTYD